MSFAMVTLQLNGLDNQLRSIVRDELALAFGQSAPASYMSVATAAAYLDTTQAAIRSMVKRRELPVSRTPNGRLLFERDALDLWVRSAA
jgi:excisionase family DNA binding protein